MNEEKRDKEILKKQKKRILIVIGALLIFAIIYFLISLIDFESLFAEEPQNDPPSYDIKFYSEELSKYPSEDEYYMNELAGDIMFWSGSGTEFGESIKNEKDAIARGEPVHLLYNLIDYIKAGDHESYNSCFSSHYFKTSPEQNAYTKQKIYDIIITEHSIETKSEDGKSFIEYTYKLEYKIRHNNGSLRKDIGSDHCKPQYFVMSNRTGEGLLIDRIFTLNITIE